MWVSVTYNQMYSNKHSQHLSVSPYKKIEKHKTVFIDCTDLSCLMWDL